jgi:ADP-heptose:LPS heptosyltransferase
MRRLILRPGAIGDTVVGLPAIEFLCQGVDAKIWAPEPNLPLLRHLAPVRSFHSVRLDMLEIDPPTELVTRLRGFDEVVSWYGAARAEFCAALTAAAPSCRLLSAIPPTTCGCHAADYYLHQVGAPVGAIPHLPRREPGGYIAIHPFSGSARKNWPLSSFQAVAARLSETLNLPVEWCAGPEEQLDGARRFDTLDTLIDWLGGANLFLGNDSGPSHIAAACGVPTVAIFLTTDPAVWAPRGQRVAVVTQPSSQNEVFTFAMSLFGGVSA